MLRLCLALAFVPCAAAPSSADSDGYFCHGPGYLAYEIRSSGTPGRHELHVVRFGAAAGISPDAAVLLTDFQVHGMRCLPQAIELAGWDTLYTIDLASRRVTTRAERLDPSRREPQNLGYWSRPAVVDLSADDGGRFQLVMNRVSQPIDRGIEHHTVSRLVRREEAAGAAGAARIVASVTLFEGVFREPVD